MSFLSFLKLVEIQTKTASVIPFLLGTLYCVYRYNAFRMGNFLLMLVSLLSIDMATTALNNYLDYKYAKQKYGFGYESHNAIVRDNLKDSYVLTVIFALLILAVLSGVLLFLNTSMIVLVLGLISFVVGVFYTYGPVPISRTPFGEVFSGAFMGFMIPFISIYIHAFDRNFASMILQAGELIIALNVWEIICIIILAFPAILGIANIMLANNICDICDDIENKRYTLVSYIGIKHSIRFFEILYYIAYVDILIAVILGILPPISVVALLTFIPVYKGILTFREIQSKKDTFVIAVKNFTLINFTLVLTIAVALVMNLFI